MFLFSLYLFNFPLKPPRWMREFFFFWGGGPFPPDRYLPEVLIDKKKHEVSISFLVLVDELLLVYQRSMSVIFFSL
jgi:hypothetical protein